MPVSHTYSRIVNAGAACISVCDCLLGLACIFCVAGLLQLQKKINRERNVVNWFQRNI